MGGAGNVLVNFDQINGVWDFCKFFGVGAAAGALSSVGINSSGINTLLGKGASYASTIKIRLNQNVFGEKGKAEDFEKNIRNLI